MRSLRRLLILPLLLLLLAAMPVDPASVPVPTAPGDPLILAARIAEVERGIRDPARSPAEAGALGHAQQVLLRALVLDPALEEAVLPALPDDLQQPVRATVVASRAIRSTVGGKRSQLPAWRIVPAESPETLKAAYQQAAADHGVPWEALAAIHLVETRMGRLRGVSGAGARGPMQFIPETWARFGRGDIEDTTDAIQAAARHLRHHGARDQLSHPGLDKALWHYNPSDHYVKAVRGYAELIAQEPALYRGFWGWQVYYRTIRGPIWLPVGYAEQAPVPVSAWCAVEGRCPE